MSRSNNDRCPPATSPWSIVTVHPQNSWIGPTPVRNGVPCDGSPPQVFIYVQIPFPAVRTSDRAATDETGDGVDGGHGLPIVLSVDELAGFLKVNRKTVYDAIKRGEVPGVRKLGDTYRISRDAVLRWLAEGRGRVSRSRRRR